MIYNRNFYCGFLNIFFLNKIIVLCGWIYKIRKHGKIFFIDLKDKSGIIQLVFKNYFNNYKFIFKLNSCILIKSLFILRNQNSLNFFLNTGFFELIILEIFFFNYSIKTNFFINFNLNNKKRFKNRCIDLKSNFMQNNLFIKYSVYKYIRFFFNFEKFIDIETPYLINISKDGSRNFLIPHRFNIGKFFSLPQSPQLFKQVLMISGFDKYYQIVKCFRDENFRSDRQSEFTQLDFEISFYNIKDIMLIFENLLSFIFLKFLNYFFNNNFFSINYNISKFLYFNDKPDLRFKLKFYNFIKINIFFKKYKYFKIFFINIPFGIKLFGKNFKNFKFFLLFFYFNNFFLIFNFLNFNYYINFFNVENHFFLKKIKFEIFNLLKININDVLILFFIKNKIYKKNFLIFYLKLITSKFGKFNNFINFNLNLIWIKNFYLLKYNYKINNYKFYHNPFSLPFNLDILYLDLKPEIVLSISYDIVYNGIEIGGGSLRNSKLYLQKKILLITKNFKNKFFDFKFLLKSLKLGAPLHAGIALGLDRLSISLIGLKNIKDIIAFPKNNNNNCIFTNSPNILKFS